MTLKELRISKGLNQSECAAYIGMSTRNYQNYENNAEKTNTAKYNSIIRKLELYGRTYEFTSEGNIVYGSFSYKTNVIVSENLKSLTSCVLKLKKRECFEQLKNYCTRENDGKIAILYGLRRTGKSTLLFQMINELPLDKTAYIKITTSDNMSLLRKDLEALNNAGYKYVFIDEITLMDDFIDTAALLSDIFATMGMKIVVSGTDSLGFAMANRDELYDRNILIHTSYIPFREYSKLLGIDSIDNYIEFGGTLKKENMSFDDPDSKFDSVSFRDDESTRKYIDTSISRNIQHTLKNDRFGSNFNQLRELYESDELTNVINRIVENMNHQFLLSVVENEFKSHDLGSAKELLLHEQSSSISQVLYEVDEKKIIERLKSIIDIKERCDTKINVTNEHIEKIKKYLFMLDLLVSCNERYETKGQAELTMFCQPGMRYSIAKALVYCLMQDDIFSSQPEMVKNHIIEKLLEDVKGRMLEDIVLLETSKSSSKLQDVFKFKFDNGAEYDMVIYDKSKNTCKLYEIKHSDKIDARQTKYLKDNEKNAIVSYRFGKIVGKYVLYRGKTKILEDIEYVNVEEYLKRLK